MSLDLICVESVKDLAEHLHGWQDTLFYIVAPRQRLFSCLYLMYGVYCIRDRRQDF
jgi:hypothetical protein